MICKGKEKSVTGLSTLCYIEKDGKYLMLHRTVKKNDVNKDKWIGVGGHFEADESPEECILREVKEETGYTLNHYTSGKGTRSSSVCSLRKYRSFRSSWSMTDMTV